MKNMAEPFPQGNEFEDFPRIPPLPSGEVEKVLEIGYREGIINLKEQVIVAWINEFYPIYATPENPPGTRSVEFFILEEVTKEIEKILSPWLKMSNEELHSKPFWKEIVAIVEKKVTELDKERKEKETHG